VQYPNIFLEKEYYQFANGCLQLLKLPLEHSSEPNLAPSHERDVRADLAYLYDLLAVLDPTQAESPDILQVFGQDTNENTSETY